MSHHYAALERMSEHLGNGCYFWVASEVRRFQLCVHSWNWVRGTPEEEPRFDAEQFIGGWPHEWTDRILISMEKQVTPEDIEAIRSQRNRTSTGLNAVFSRWQEESLTFEDQFNLELSSFGPAILREYHRFHEARGQVLSGLRQPTLETLLPPSAVVLVNTMCIYLQDRGVNQTDSLDLVRQYICSDALRFVPSLRISSMLWAALARKAASGQKRPPTQGMSNDVEMASATLPYVDAAFLDNELCGLLHEEPLRSNSGINAALFSPNSVEDFLAYLRGLIAASPATHLELARSVYGEDGLQPYRQIFEDKVSLTPQSTDNDLDECSSPG